MSLNPTELFQPYVPPSVVRQGQDLTKMHYAVNLGAMELHVNMYQFGTMRRGIIYPVSGNDRWENNSDSTDESREIIQAYYQPGLVAEAIERDFQDKGFRVLRNVTGWDLPLVQQMHEMFRFEDLDEWPNAKILEFLKVQSAKGAQFVDMAKFLTTQLQVINGYQLQHMAEAQREIKDNKKAGLSNYDKLVCKAIGRNPSDYEINEVERRKAAAEAQGGLIEDFAKAVVGATKGEANAEVALLMKKNEQLEAMLEKQGKVLEGLQSLLKEKK